MPRKELESIRGFLVYVSRTYQEMIPYLKGVHLTIDGWQKGRNAEGWRLRGKALLAAVAEGKVTLEEPDDAPDTVRAVPRLEQDIKALAALVESDEPPVRPLRAKRVAYCFLVGDASGEGQGAIYLPKGAAMVQDGEV